MDQEPPLQRLNTFVALALGVSRRQADAFIEKSQVYVNGQVAIIGQRIKPDDKVSYQDRHLTPKAHQLILLNKPTGYLCSRASQGGVPTIYALLPDTLSHLKPVGRLDKDSSGLLLLTNDGAFAHKMTHPSFYKVKRYTVTLNNPLQPLHQQMISDFGIELPDGPSKMVLTRQHENDDTRWVVEMSEGRNRQIRRTFLALGYTVTRLHRTHFGDYSLGDIPRGHWRYENIP